MELTWAVAAMIGILLSVLCIWLAAVFIKWLCSLDWTFEFASGRRWAAPLSTNLAHYLWHYRKKSSDNAVIFAPAILVFVQSPLV